MAAYYVNNDGTKEKVIIKSFSTFSVGKKPINTVMVEFQEGELKGKTCMTTTRGIVIE